MDEEAKKAREEYLKRYLSKDDNSKTKKKVRKKSKMNGLKIHENDAFIAVAPCAEQNSDIDSEDIEVIKRDNEKPRFQPAIFEPVEFKMELSSKRHDSSSSESGLLMFVSDDLIYVDDDFISASSSCGLKKDEIAKKNHSSSQKCMAQSTVNMDICPEQRKIKQEPLDSDMSPPRRLTQSTKLNSNEDSDISPPRRRIKNEPYDSDESPLRRSEIYNSDESTSDRYDRRKKRRRKDRDRNERSTHKHHRHEGHQNSTNVCHVRGVLQDNDHDRKDSNIANRKYGGIKTLEEYREEMKQSKQNEAELLEAWSGYSAGKDAVAVQRTKVTGKGREKIEDRGKKERETKKQQELDEKYKKWSKGVRQIEERAEKLNEMARVAQEDFARHADNIAMNEYLKEVKSRAL
ncbi:unnamed protein product [Thelazia callipaeda]|uniref:BUD13 homolog n=1 Tax=Thelazia callipaeda TaxID=103827 RepID=A0A0N5CXH3_THECL|nr:unnamed protein product [Thelazia callipaeda]